MVAYPGKFQIMFLESNTVNSKITFMIEKERVKSRSEVKLLGTTIDDKLSFTFASFSKNTKIFFILASKTSIEAYIISTFYCPFIWMFCSKTADNLINKIHKRSLRVIHVMEKANFENLLIKDRFINYSVRSISL